VFYSAETILASIPADTPADERERFERLVGQVNVHSYYVHTVVQHGSRVFGLSAHGPLVSTPRRLYQIAPDVEIALSPLAGGSTSGDCLNFTAFFNMLPAMRQVRLVDSDFQQIEVHARQRDREGSRWQGHPTCVEVVRRMRQHIEPVVTPDELLILELLKGSRYVASAHECHRARFLALVNAYTELPDSAFAAADREGG
jgi:hypothetical protein